MHRKQMMACILCILFISTGFTGCKKNAEPTPEEVNGGYYLRCKIDGVLTEFIVAGVFAELPEAPVAGTHSFAVGGVKSISSMWGLTLVVNEFTGTAIKAGVEYKMAYAAGIPQRQAFLSYSNTSGEGYQTAMLYTAAPYESAGIVLTGITDNYVKGTFYGKLLVNETASSTVKYTIKDGEFYLPRKKTSPPVTNTDFIEFKAEGKTIRVDESTDPLSTVTASFYTIKTPGAPDVYKNIIQGMSNVLSAPYYNLTLSVADLEQLKASTYSLVNGTGIDLKPHFNLLLGYKETSSGPLYSYMTSILNTSFSVDFTRFSIAKGQTIEGTFTATNLLKTNQAGATLASNIALTEGKFRITIQ